MNWTELVNDKRLGLEDYHDPKKNPTRTDFRRDYDRLVFSSPFRRLQNKTQVFPLPGSIFVHNRLTHSLEVSCVGKSMADNIAVSLRRKYSALGEPTEQFDHIGDIVAAACLAHALGDPPFGHSGEKAIGTFFSEGKGLALKPFFSAAEWSDLICFEGNANAFRVLTHQFNGRRKGGFAMTYSTLASIVKYPFESGLSSKGKFGFFTSEREDYLKVASTLGIKRLSEEGEPLRFARHPLVYIVEAADDICYEVMDIEDAHLRSCVVGALVERCAETFIANEDAILDGTFVGPLIGNISDREREGYSRCAELSWSKIYRSADVVDVELAGNRIITFLLEALVDAVVHPELNYSRLLLAKFPGQYDVSAPTLFGKVQAVLDHVSAMTDVNALDLYRKLNGWSLPAV